MGEEEQKLHESSSPLLDLQTVKAVSVLGRGAKGTAFLIRTQQQTLALKVISKDLLEKKKKPEKPKEKENDKEEEENVDPYKRIWFERDVLSMFNHPLLPTLRGVLSTDEVIGVAMDYCSGGDLNFLRRQQTEKMFSYDVIRFYAAELVLVLEYLHGLGVIYRDLKPENILIQENGHLMIVDFDLSTKLTSNRSQFRSSSKSEVKKTKKKRRNPMLFLCKSGFSQVDSVESKSSDSETESIEKSNSFVGTEEYVAPEIIKGDGHDFAVDWWSLGVVLYEMLYGRTPFRGINRKETFYRILTKSPELVGEPNELRNLIAKLLEKDPLERITVEEIKGHGFFKDVVWDSILSVSRPPFIPPMKWDDESDLEEIDGLDVHFVVKGSFNGNNLEKVEEKKGENVWVEGLKNPTTDDDFLIF